jgi:ABC-type ATPase with predicted acetyltransferase domain
MRTLSKSFTVNIPQDGVVVAEAFGVDSSFEKVVFKDLRVPEDYQILYITGESGSGKSTILNALHAQTELIVPEGSLCTWGFDQKETLRVLSMVGLGDASLFLNTYDELSDSQQARARMAKMVLDGNEILVIDEFLSTLDRKTAKAVAYMFGKNVRRLGLRAVLASAHDDLIYYLQPDVVVSGKAFPSEFSVDVSDDVKFNPFNLTTEYRWVDKHFYRNLRLGELHYKGKYTGGTKEHLAAFIDNECVGILVATNRINDDGRRIARLVVHPSYRGCGVGAQLVRTYISRFPKTDVVAAMAHYNPVFERAGMVKAKDVVVRPPAGLAKDLADLGFEKSKWFEKSYCDAQAVSLAIREAVSRHANKAGNLVAPGGKRPSTAEVAEKIVTDPKTAGRVLWGFRPRTMAKYVVDTKD